ncbi:MAG TPA: 5'-methylthioadenosine/S-adenosylhomocysteine nucleosidase [Lacunisphaera sp.]|nr:5'-methylthioadenosine/S-adenosylhomocysteine nucleosidase [Lacunisphaera sp.]
MTRRRWFLLLLLAGGLRLAAADVLLAAATDEELQPVRARLVDLRTETRAGWQFWLGTLDGRSLVLTRTEGDPLNAVAATTLAIRRYAPRLVISCGAARAHDPALRPGDVVVSREFAAFDGMVSPHRELGAGTAPLTWHKMPHPLMTSGEQETRQERFPADPDTLARAGKLAAVRGRVVAGVLGSAHQVNREADRIAYLRAQWGTDTEDGESAHIAGCALLFGVPAFGLRVVDGQPGEAAALVLQLLEAKP